MNAFWAFISLLAPSDTLSAPVYTQISESALRRSGTFQYKPGDEAYEILFCISSPPRVTLRCVVKTPLDLLVVIEATATERET